MYISIYIYIQKVKIYILKKVYKSGWSSKSVCEKSFYINVTSYYKRNKKKLVQKKRKTKTFQLES